MARQALDQTVDAIKAIPDPVKRSQIAVALFGTQAEDLGGALDALDLDTVADDMDGVAGATDRAADTMRDNAASAIESAQRSIEVAWGRVQQTMGRLASPFIEQFGAWVGEHTGDITRFFLGVADGAVLGAQAVLKGVSLSIGFIGKLVNAFGDSLGTLTRAGAKLADLVGADGIAAEWRAASEDMYGWGDGLLHTADGMDIAADSLDGMRDEIHGLAEDAKNSQQFVNGLGDAAESLEMRDGRVVLTDNTPEVLDNIDQTQYAITHLEDGTVELVPLTEDATRKMDGWRRQQGGEPTEVPVEANTSQADADMQAFLSRYPMLDPNAPPTNIRVGGDFRDLMLPPAAPVPAPRARGGIYNVWDRVASFAGGKLPRQALIQPAVSGAGLVQWAEPSTRGEAFIPLAPANRQRSLAIWTETGKRLGAIRSYATGGLNAGAGYVRGLIQQMYPQITDIGGWRPEDGYGEHSSGNALDVMIPNWNTPQGKALGDAIAGWAVANGQALGLSHVLWQQRSFGTGDATGTPMEDRGSPTQNHLDHVHIFLGKGGGALPSGPLMPGVGSVGSGTSLSGFRSGGGSSKVRDAENRLADAEGNVREREARLAEVQADADAKESQRISAEEDLAKARRDRDTAAAELSEARATADDDETESGKTKQEGPDAKSFGQDMLSGALEFFGLDGSVFSNPFDWGIWKLFTGGANYVGGLLKNFQGGGPSRISPYGGSASGTQHGRGAGSPGPGNQGDGGLGGFQLGDGGGMSSVGDTLMGALPQVSDFLPSAASQAGPIDASINIQGNVDQKTFGDMRSANLNRVRSAGSGLKGMGGF